MSTHVLTLVCDLGCPHGVFVVGTYRPGKPAGRDGPPEDCDPGEPPEFVVDAVWLDGQEVGAEILRKGDIARIIEECRADAAMDVYQGEEDDR